jgi:hypothetical protein
VDKNSLNKGLSMENYRSESWMSKDNNFRYSLITSVVARGKVKFIEFVARGQLFQR